MMNNAKKRILILSSSPRLTRGGQQSILLLLKSLNRELYDPVLLCMQDGDLPNAARELNIKVIIQDLPTLRTLNIFKISEHINYLRQKLFEWTIDIVHSEFSRGNFYFGMAIRGTGIPLIWHVRISNTEGFLYERFLYVLAERIIAVSKSAARRFLRFPEYTEKVSIAYNAVDPNEFNPEHQDGSFREELAIDGHSVLFGIIGEVLPLKGQLDFVEAAVKVCKYYENARFVIIGEGSKKYVKHINTFIRDNSLTDKIKFVPFRPNISTVFSDLDVVVNASMIEGFSRTILEAMACAKPVIATRVGGNPEAVQDGVTGFLVPPKDASSLAEAMMELIKSPEKMTEMGSQARQRVCENFTPQITARKIEEVYRQLLDDKKVF